LDLGEPAASHAEPSTALYASQIQDSILQLSPEGRMQQLDSESLAGAK